MGMTSTGSGKPAEHAHQLRVVDDADEAPRGAGDDLFPGERAAAALDEMPVPGDLIGAVHVDIQVPGPRQFGDRDAEAPEPGRGRLRTGRHRLQPRRVLSQGVDEEIHRAAGTHAQGHPAPNLLDRRHGRESFPVVRIHVVGAVVSSAVMKAHSAGVTGVIESRLPRRSSTMSLSGPVGVAAQFAQRNHPPELALETDIHHVPAWILRIALRIVVLVGGVERRVVGMRLPAHGSDADDARFGAIRVVVEHGIADLHPVAHEVARLVVAHSVPERLASGRRAQIVDAEVARFGFHEPVIHRSFLRRRNGRYPAR